MKTSQKPLISVLMLTYNHAAYIGKAIQSVLEQKTDYTFELIICDDASTDGTRKIASDWAKKDDRIVLSFQDKNTKFGKNFTDGCSLIRGKYVAFCEGDDYWTNTAKLQRQVEFLENNPDFSVCAHRAQMLFMGADSQPDTRSAYVYKDCSADEQRIRDGVFYADEAIANYYFQTGTLVLRWRFGGGLPHWFRKRMMFDHFMFMLHAVEGKIKYFDEAMSVWRRHGGGYTWLQTQDKGLFFQKEGEDWINLYSKMDEFFSGRFHTQIRERILLALRAMAQNCMETGNLDHSRRLVEKYKPFFDDVLRDAPLIDTVRLAYPERPEFSPPWQSAPSLEAGNGMPGSSPPLGGCFGLAMDDIPICENNVWSAWTNDREYASFYNLRYALLRILWDNGVSTVWLPSYCPPQLVNALSLCQFVCQFYSVTPELEQETEFMKMVKPGEGVLTINYLGRPMASSLRQMLENRCDVLWIQDMAQSVDPAEGQESGIAIYSPSKNFGVPDGGLATCRADGRLAEYSGMGISDKEPRELDMLLQRYEAREDWSNQQNLYWKKNQLERQTSSRGMSRISMEMLKRIPLPFISAKRKSNWAVLYEKLGTYCLWNIPHPQFTPHAFPFLAPEGFTLEILHTALARENIFCERMWFPLPSLKNSFPDADALSKRLLLLPCDQRHTAQDMDRIAMTALKSIENQHLP